MGTGHAIKDVAKGLEVGEKTTHQLCPKCSGGDGNEKSFIIWRNDTGYIYKCYRASCGWSGSIRRRIVNETPQVHTPRELPLNPFFGSMLPLTGKQRAFLNKKFDLPVQTLENYRWSGYYQRVVMPLYSPDGSLTGHILRGYEELGEFQGPKALTRWAKRDCADLHFAMPLGVPFNLRSGSTAVLVEDVISADKISMSSLPCISLLGTGFTAKQAVYLAGMGIKKLIIWLDADAHNKAIKFMKDYGLYFDKISIVSTDADPKDCSYATIGLMLAEEEE